jgi:hypothetical protein
LVVVEFCSDVFQNVPPSSMPVKIGVWGGLASWPEPHPEAKPTIAMMHGNSAIREHLRVEKAELENAAEQLVA